jgi:methylphosphotriester-DNA--protein-cysteine methyltransferase
MAYNHLQIFQKLDAILSSTPRSRLSDITHTLRVERHTIGKAVRESTGLSFRQYRDHKLLECSLRLLKHEGGLSEKEIAVKLGFSASPSFSRFVKRHCGQAPTLIRENGAGTGENRHKG